MNKRAVAFIALVGLGLALFWSTTAYAHSDWTSSRRPAQGMMYGMMHGGMMGNGMGMYGMWGGRSNVEPLSLEEAETAVTGYLATLNQDKWAVGEIMIFENHAYVQIVDTTTGKGAFEVLVDPVSRRVLPEPGPNMMWNTEYGMMGGGMMGGGMMHGGMGGSYAVAPGADISVAADEAVDIAQRYLDNRLPGATAATTVDAFPGYYTLHFLKNDEVTGMLSVNAYTGEVFLHTWHGAFITMLDEAH